MGISPPCNNTYVIKRALNVKATESFATLENRSCESCEAHKYFHVFLPILLYTSIEIFKHYILYLLYWNEYPIQHGVRQNNSVVGCDLKLLESGVRAF